MHVHVRDVHFIEDPIAVDLFDGKTIIVPLVQNPWLLHAALQQRLNWQIAGAGFHIHWYERDEDLSTESLLRGTPALGLVPSAA